MAVSVQGTPSTLLLPAGATSYTISVPSGSASGDLVLVLGFNTGSSTTVLSPPSDGTWTSTTAYATGSTGSAARVQGFYKTLTGSASTFTFTSASTNAIPGFVTYLLRKDSSSTWSISSTGVALDSSSPYTDPSLTTPGPAVAVAAAASRGNAGNSYTLPGALTSDFNQATTGTNTPMVAGGHQVLSTAGTAGTYDFTSTTSVGTALINITASYVAPTDLSATVPIHVAMAATIRVSVHGSATVPIHVGMTGNLEVIPRTSVHLSSTIPITFGMTEDIRVSEHPIVDLSAAIPITFGMSGDMGILTLIHLDTVIHVDFGMVAAITVVAPVDLSAQIDLQLEMDPAELEVGYPHFTVTLDNPIDDDRVVTVRPVLGLRVQQSEPAYTIADVQVQVSTDPDFGSTVADFTIETDKVYGVVETVPMPVDLTDGTTYYWRARSLLDGDLADPWSGVGSFSIDLTVGDAAEYGFWNVVDTGTAVPHLWFAVDPRVKTGDLVTLVGMGFGDKTATVVLDDDTLTTDSNVVVPADDDAYTDARIIDSINNEVNVEHDVIKAIVSTDNVPGGPIGIEVA